MSVAEGASQDSVEVPPVAVALEVPVGLSVRYQFRARTIPYEDVAAITVTEVSPTADFGGVGV